MDLKPITRKEIFLQKIIDNTAMGGVTINNQDKTITENGTYTADEGYTGLGTVTVDVQSGGGGDEASVLDGLIERSITEISSNAKSVGDYAFYYNTTITNVVLRRATNIGTYSFRDCSKLINLDCPLVSYVGTGGVQGCKNIEKIDFPNIEKIGSNAFRDCTKLSVLTLRNETLISIDANGVLASTAIHKGNGYIYVPKSLLSDTDSTKDYRQATNWSTFGTQFRALEDYTVDGTITGELDPTKI